MEPPEFARKTRAIVFSDIQGYSRMMGEDETLALGLLGEHNALCVPLIERLGGTILKFIGDAILSSFESASDAVNCGMAIQRALAQRNAGRPKREQIVVRIGIHIGDVVIKDGDIFGDGVNVAARIEPLAEPGGIAISQTVYDMIKARPEIQTISLGPKDLKNIKDAVNIYKVLIEAQAPGSPRGSTGPGNRSWFLAAVGVAAVLAAGAGAVWFLKKGPVPAQAPAPQTAAPRALVSGPSPGSAGIEWVKIPGGSFMMGSMEEPREWPAHRVTVKGFEMAKTAVTFKQYRACVEAGICNPPHVSDGNCALWFGARWELGNLSQEFQTDEQPVVCVDWQQAGRFAEWAGGRLPTEAEWEYAARSAGKEWKYPWGNDEVSCERAVIGDGGGGCGRHTTWPVCSKTTGNTEQGLCDMVSNVRQFAQDWYHDSYKGAPADGSSWESPPTRGRVIRGGSWLSERSHNSAIWRDSIPPGHRDEKIGFRLVR